MTDGVPVGKLTQVSTGPAILGACGEVRFTAIRGIVVAVRETGVAECDAADSVYAGGDPVGDGRALEVAAAAVEDV